MSRASLEQQAAVCEAVRKHGFKAMLLAILSASRPRTRALTAEKTTNAGEEANKADNLLQNMREKVITLTVTQDKNAFGVCFLMHK